MKILDYFRSKETLLRRIARLEVKVEHERRRAGGFQGHNTQLKKELDELTKGAV